MFNQKQNSFFSASSFRFAIHRDVSITIGLPLVSKCKDLASLLGVYSQLLLT